MNTYTTVGFACLLEFAKQIFSVLDINKMLRLITEINDIEQD